MIVTGEASGDLHGSNLLKAVQKELDTPVKTYGMGGPLLASCGMQLLYDAAKVSVVGISEVVTHLKDIVSAQRILARCLQDTRPDVLVLIDLPDFNLRLAKKAKSLNIPVFYYIAPQVWAWRTSRVNIIRQRVDQLGVILPFEAAFFKRNGVKATYVGHPLLDSVKTTLPLGNFRASSNIDEDAFCVGLLPGSRKKEVSSLLPLFLKAASKIKLLMNCPVVFLLPVASTITFVELEAAGLSDYQNILDIKIVDEADRYNMMAACDCAVAASGTVTLELAILQIPMVVCYKLSGLTYFLGKLLVKVEYFSLVNLIAGYEAVQELLQDEVQPDRIAKELCLLLNSYSHRSKMQNCLQQVKEKLGEAGASHRAAKIVGKILQESVD